jgi:hypothetical protein
MWAATPEVPVRTPIRVAIVALSVLGFALACREPTGLRWGIRRGTIQSDSGTSLLDVPQTIVAGQPAVFTIYTYGGGCVRQAYTRSSLSGSMAILEPFDSVVVAMPDNMGCTLELRMFAHSATFTFPGAGSATIRVVGWKEPDEVEVTREQSIIVQ